jgi:hypothetical protein
MRRTTDIYAILAAVALGAMVLLAGCRSTDSPLESPAEPVRADANEPLAPAEPPSSDTAATAEPQTPIDLTLDFVPGRTTTYRIATETEAAVRWEGDDANKPAAFRGGAIGNHVEITFDQRIDRIHDDGNAAVEITIRALKYLGRSRQTVVVDFDSARDAARDSPLSRLIGRTYEVEITPQGAVASVGDLTELRASFEGPSPDHQTALKLISDEEIRERHEVPPLMALEDESARPGQTWSNVKMLSFGRMGAKAYERLYTLERIETDDADQTAHISMKGIPSAAAAQQLYQNQTNTVPTGMFDNIDSYEGQLAFDLDTGRIDTYAEQFRTEWVAVDPEAVQSGAAHPPAIRMTRTLLHRLERITP